MNPNEYYDKTPEELQKEYEEAYIRAKIKSQKKQAQKMKTMHAYKTTAIVMSGIIFISGIASGVGLAKVKDQIEINNAAARADKQYVELYNATHEDNIDQKKLNIVNMSKFQTNNPNNAEWYFDTKKMAQFFLEYYPDETFIANLKDVMDDLEGDKYKPSYENPEITVLDDFFSQLVKEVNEEEHPILFSILGKYKKHDLYTFRQFAIDNFNANGNIDLAKLPNKELIDKMETIFEIVIQGDYATLNKQTEDAVGRVF